MKIIIGLGNPGKEYKTTRHNAGFLGADFLQKEWGFAPFTLDKKMSAEISSGMIENEKVLIAKPQTFMNNSGEAVWKLLQFYKLSPSDIAVIHDDLDIAAGKFKITTSSRAAGHNGVQNIIKRLGTQEFLRTRLGIGGQVRLGIDASNNQLSSEGFVLQNFSQEELAELTKLFPEVKEHLLIWLKA
jgi:PTH1 family peptidyl-tRNA hydrolase